MLLAYFSACFCVATRAILALFDRQLFRNNERRFFYCIFLNALLPFACAMTFAWLLNDKLTFFSVILWKPAVLFSAAGAQAAAYYFSKGFQQMHVRSVVAASKLADLFIALILFILTTHLNIEEYLFSVLTTCIFYPVIKDLWRRKGHLKLWTIAALVLCPCLQAAINSYFSVYTFAVGWKHFSSLVAAILFWRMVFVGCFIPFKINSLCEGIARTSLKTHALIALRSIIAFSSQAAFFYSITRASSAVAWPVLNSGPLLTCFAAHFILKERLSRDEQKVAYYFLMLSVLYLSIHRG